MYEQYYAIIRLSIISAWRHCVDMKYYIRRYPFGVRKCKLYSFRYFFSKDAVPGENEISVDDAAVLEDDDAGNSFSERTAAYQWRIREEDTVRDGRRITRTVGRFQIHDDEVFVKYTQYRFERSIWRLSFFHMFVDGVMYKAYPVGLGRRGIYLCVYEGDMLTAVVSKRLRDQGFTAEYIVYTDKYIEKDSIMDIMMPLVMTWDVFAYGHGCPDERHRLYTWNRYQREKFSFEFLEQMAMDGIVVHDK